MEKTLISPTMALNAEGVTPYFQMDNNYIVPKTHTPANMLNWIKTYSLQQGGRLNSLIIHCHGAGTYEGGIQITDEKSLFEKWTYGYGLNIGTGITMSDVKLFEVLKGAVKDIYITACGAAQKSPDLETKKGTISGDGNLFCGAIAKTTGANVYASLDEQIKWSFSEWRTKNTVEFNGVVLRYKPDGSNQQIAHLY